MGIRPYARGQVPVPAERDDVKSRYGAWIDDLEDAGAKTGEAYAEIDAKASSSNESAAQLAADITALEARVGTLEEKPEYAPPPVETISGSGWSARRQGRLVVVTVYGATTGWVMPAGWRPAATTHVPAAARTDGQTALARIGFLGGGTVSIMDTTSPVYTSATYFTP